jgi:hypothetical protein
LRHPCLAAITFAIFSVTTTIAAQAADTFYVGRWRFTTATMAPWGYPARLQDSADKAQLVGKTITFKAKEIAGPQPLACKGPSYRVSDFTADLLFQGALEEMQTRDKSVDPVKLAAALGFTGTSIKTLETGCEIDFHFIDRVTAEIALDDYIYTLKKQ